MSGFVVPDAVARILTNHQEDILEGIEKLKSRLVNEKERLVVLGVGGNIVNGIDALNLSDEQKAAAVEFFGDVTEQYNEQVNMIGKLMSVIEKAQLESNIVDSFIKEYTAPTAAPCSPPMTDEQLELPHVEA